MLSWCFLIRVYTCVHNYVAFNKFKLSDFFSFWNAAVANHFKLLYIKKKTEVESKRRKVTLIIASQTVNFSVVHFYMAAYHRVAENIQRVRLL